MTSDAHKRLCVLKEELYHLPSWPWSNIVSWSAKAIPIIRRDWPDDSDDFRQVVAEPQWTMTAGEWFASEQSGNWAVIGADSDKARQVKDRILSFLGGLLTISETDDGQSVRHDAPAKAIVEKTPADVAKDCAMDVLISWSKKQSREMASVFHGWLPKVVPGLRPWMSSKDIDKGKLWFGELQDFLGEATSCIICVTGENVRSPWIYYETVQSPPRSRTCWYAPTLSASA